MVSIWEAHYPEWIENVVLVKKANDKWRVCTNFIDLNRACPKDSFSFPRIDQLVDATTGHQLLIFMDAYLRYNQIKMALEDEENTSFITSILLKGDAIQSEKCWSHLPPFGKQNVC